MKLLYDFFPILLFFIVFKIFGIYTATAVAIATSFIQVLLYRLKYQCFEKVQVISSIIIVTLGGATLFFHNPVFFKWKPTGVYWLSALVFLGSSFIGKKSIIQKMMEHNINLPTKIWYRLNNAWGVFFIFLGALNLYVAYHYELDTWVNFKLFGGTGLTLLFVLLQAFYLSRHVIEPSLKESKNAPAAR